MTTAEPRPPVAAGEQAPDFTLPSVDGKAQISLSDYRGKSPVLLALLLGLWCPFCRRQLALMGANDTKLKPLGVETLAIVATRPENAQLYFKFRPSPLRLASDPQLTTHHSYGLPRPEPNAEFMNTLATTLINPNNDFPKPLPVMEAAVETAKRDGYVETATDFAERDRQFPQLKGYFLIDRGGIVRWAQVECATDGAAGVGKPPATEEIVAAAREIAGR